MQRMWIDQPSTLQPFHELHGTNVLAEDEEHNGRVYVWFLRDQPITYGDGSSGNVQSMRVPTWALSNGWRTTRREPVPALHLTRDQENA